MNNRWVASFACVALSGCSFFMVRGPSDPQPQHGYAAAEPDCTDSMGWPIADGVLAGVFLMSALGAVAQTDEQPMSTLDDDRDHNEVVASGLVMGSIAAASAYVGYSRVRRCREAREQYAASNPYGPQPYAQPYGPQPYGPYPGQYPVQAYPQAQPQAYPQPQPYPQAQPQAYPQPQPYPQPYPQPQYAPPQL
jgi:hypothetical protein